MPRKTDIPPMELKFDDCEITLEFVIVTDQISHYQLQAMVTKCEPFDKFVNHAFDLLVQYGPIVLSLFHLPNRKSEWQDIIQHLYEKDMVVYYRPKFNSPSKECDLLSESVDFFNWPDQIYIGSNPQRMWTVPTTETYIVYKPPRS